MHDDEEMILLAIIEGSLISYDDEGNTLAIDDVQMHLQRYLVFGKEQGFDIDESLICRT